jgi:hypothetical protein
MEFWIEIQVKTNVEVVCQRYFRSLSKKKLSGMKKCFNQEVLGLHEILQVRELYKIYIKIQGSEK